MLGIDKNDHEGSSECILIRPLSKKERIRGYKSITSCGILCLLLHWQGEHSTHFRYDYFSKSMQAPKRYEYRNRNQAFCSLPLQFSFRQVAFHLRSVPLSRSAMHSVL